MGPDRRRFLEREVGVDEHVGVRHELGLLLRGQVEVGEVGIVPKLLDGAVEVLVGSERGALGRRPGQQALECTVDERALRGVRLGGSGSRSMLENRKASGQLVNDSTRDGERLVGTGYGMAPMVGRGCREVAGPVSPGRGGPGRSGGRVGGSPSGQHAVGEGHDPPGRPPRDPAWARSG
jgi:hypothetical protein